MNPRYRPVAQRAAHQCEYCHAPESIFNFPFEVEHIIPVCLGGLQDEVNLALACRSCNVAKAKIIEAYDPETRATVRLFQPRADKWGDHFRFDEPTGSLIGLTPIGRVTIERLQMNRPSQLAARRQWMRLGIFPPG